jgi:MFS family permease
MVAVAAVADSVPLLFGALFLYGAGTATNLQARYAGADLADPAHRGRAVSTVLVVTTIGAVIGPNLVEPTGHLAEELGIPALAGPFLLAAAVYVAAAAVVTAFLRPDPLLVARELALQAPPAQPHDAAGSLQTVRLGATAMILTQLVMVAVMSMTPIHMRDHGHGLGATGIVIAIHIACMYLPSPLTGMLVDRYGRRPIIAAGGGVLVASGILAAAAPADSVVVLSVALALLGLGWNLGLIGGTALVTDATPPETRAKTQGAVDLSVALSGAAGGLSGGFVVAATSYAALSMASGLIAFAILPLLLRTPRPAPEGPGRIAR